MTARMRLRIEGAVQGVGFRPFAHARANALGLSGWVINTPDGVTLEAEGPQARIDALIEALRAAPAPASVSRIHAAPIAPCGETGFAIRPSELAGARSARILPDLAPCPACLAEISDPGDRRWRYPFINCTQCGPRLSIIEDLPYDRPRTTMRRFTMCAACQAEYDNPSSRRFHAEPNACPKCGPRLALLDREGARLAEADDALIQAAARIRLGEILALKGVGGFHLIVDARNEKAVQALRARKCRPDKPFAVLFPDINATREACALSDEEEALLCGPERPIVLARRKASDIAEAVAPNNPQIGALLPYTPLHQLLMQELDFPIVATSGNLSEEPIVIDEAQALHRLAGIVDAFLSHDRGIARPVEDSVVRVVYGRPQILRRARGFAPAPIALEGARPGVLSVGGHLKSTIALTRDDGAVVWPHIGDLGSLEARETHARAIDDITRLHDAHPTSIVRDTHPDYGSRRAAENFDAPITDVQHHVAHIAACLAENGARPPALGVAWDGAGYGPDGTIWGGEFLLLNETGWRRFARLRPFPLPGGETAMREPRRAALGLLFAAYGAAAFDMDDLAPIAAFSSAERRTLQAVLARGVNAPLCSSIGRLFDAFAALAGLRQCASYEGQAAYELEWAASQSARVYEFPLREHENRLELDWGPALKAALTDLHAKVLPGEISTALHGGLVAAIVAVARQSGQKKIALSGGCFQNARLSESAIKALREAGFEPLWHTQVPPNDGGLALGQAAWGIWMGQNKREGERACA